jgi:hypothetical protein
MMKIPTLRPFYACCLALIAATVAFSTPLCAADPTTADCLAASDASLKSGNEHKLRAERGQLLVCAAPSCPSDIRKECLRRVDEVNAAIPTIIFDAKDAGGNDLSTVKVTLDGEMLAERLEGTALSIDPGEHSFTFETAGQPPVTKQFIIQESQKDRRESITFGKPAPRWVPSQPAAPQAELAPPTTNETSRGLGPQRVAAIVAAGVGVVGLGIGSAFGVVALSKKSDAQNVCADQCTTQAGVSDWSDAKSAGNVSTALFIVGGVGLAGAAILWLSAPSPTHASSVQLGLGPRGVQLKGAW